MMEQRKNIKEHEGAMEKQTKSEEEEQMYESVDDAGVKRRRKSQHKITGCLKFGTHIYTHPQQRNRTEHGITNEQTLT